MSAVLATAEGAFEILYKLDEELDDLVREVDALLEIDETEDCLELGQKIFDMLRQRIHLKLFIEMNLKDGSWRHAAPV